MPDFVLYAGKSKNTFGFQRYFRFAITVDAVNTIYLHRADMTGCPYGRSVIEL